MSKNARLHPTDEQILRRVRDGDGEALHELIDRYGPMLFRLAFSLVGNAADAEDVVQETLVGAFEQIGRFEGRSTVKTWLTRILVRQAARHHRRRGRRREESVETMDSVTSGRPQPTAGRSVADASNRRLDVRRALDRLSPDHRQVVALREFAGMSYAEMAEALGIPQGTVESRLYRARQELRTLLRDYVP